ncbi:Stk1 family PASTA domain-containing Ser/Thr kinase [Ruminococcaceae bacterium OttesenSCG-928-L11]|nr:Stk1 family PASTA domain-containing Ser/Thr kinase [Ruminococcaceae bacterium OttesenSCG-928-L11]
MDNYIGKKLEGRYEIQELIGMGGMANVYKAYDIIDDRIVAVKILRNEFLNNAEFLRRFKNESKAIAVLSHPNIVRVYDVSFANSIHYIVMEYIDGITLKDYIERQGVLTWKESVHFTLQILRALQHAHDKGIVHRDIKPHNIMLLQNGEIKVTDFGIARFARSEVRTITDRAIGSVHYISPEQAMGDSTDEKADIYSVGVMLFEMLTGRLPFEAETAVSVAIKQIQTQAVRPRSLNPDIPEGLEEITIRAMQKDAAKRYQSAAEMISDIERFKQDPSISFAYKYMDAEPEQAKRKKYNRAIQETRAEEDDMPRKKRTPYIPILTGVTMAFVIASISFIGLMVYYNNPFTIVAEIEGGLYDLVGFKYDTMAAQHDDIEIVVEEYEYNDDYGKDIIFEQRPRAGTNVKNGSVVKVKVSLGQKIATVPNFTGKDSIQTTSKLKELGITYREEYVYSDDVPIGSVVYTDPSKDSQVSSNEIVTVYISQGPEVRTVTVPSVIGLQPEGAKTLLEVYKLRLGTITEEVSDKPVGTIISQDPAPEDGMKPQNTAVNVVISKEGIERLSIPVTMPQVDRTIAIRARVGDDNVVVAEDTFNPIQDEKPVWTPIIPGDETMTDVEVKIYIDGKLYMKYSVNFETKSRTELTNRMDAEEFQ